MNTLRALLRTQRREESGLSLIEVLVAMMVFAIISIGIAYSLTSALTMTSDARSREVAANLAAQEIDFTRAVEDIFAVEDDDKVFTVNDTTFRLHRETNWITSTGADTSCGSGGGQLQYKRINVSVSWDGMRAATSPVRADTVIAPGSRINNPALGSILVSVITAGGTGAAGVTVTAVPSTPANGAVAITETIKPTDAEGCTYVLKVTPGNYKVTVSRSGYVDVNQAATSSTTVGVGASAASSAAFQYDQAGTLQVSYAGNVTTGATRLPNALDTTLRSTYGIFNSTATSNSTLKTFNLHPFGSGYEVFAGKYTAPTDTSAGCISADPAAWTTPADDGAVGPAPTKAASTESVTVPMGVITITGTTSTTWIKAVSQAYAPGDGAEGCGTTATGQVTYLIGPVNATTAQIALPFGSWLLTSGNSTSQTTAIASSRLGLLTPGTFTPGATALVTLDPRTVVAP